MLFVLVSDMFSNKLTAANAFNTDAESGEPVKNIFTEQEIIAKMKEVSKERKFAESVELTIKLNVDPTQGE